MSVAVVEGWATVDDVDAFLHRLSDIGEAHDTTVQAFDARYIAGCEHLSAAVERARRAIERGDQIADDPAIEVLCYAAGRRQIDRAMALGVKPGRGPVAIVAFGADIEATVAAIREHIDTDAVVPAERDETVIADFFSITDAERQATDASLEALVVERVALLSIEK